MGYNRGMDTTAFRHSLSQNQPPAGASAAVEALWWEGKGDWAAAHDRLQSDLTAEGAWVHAYLHRKEGDLSNASYWYNRAGKPVASGDLGAEWDAIAGALLDQPR